MATSDNMCRTANGWDINGFGQLKDGRGNICPVTIIMPTLAMEAKERTKLAKNPKEAIKECLKGNDDSIVLDEILRQIARQYFEWFYLDLNYCIKMVIDLYTENNICIKKPIIHSFIARKDSQLNKLNRDLHNLIYF